MYHLMMAVLSIGLIGAASAATVTYVNPDRIQERMWSERLDSGLQELKLGFDSYRMAGTTHLRQETVEDGIVTSYWYEEVFSEANPLDDYVTYPIAIDGASWSYGQVDREYYFCLNGTITPYLKAAAEHLQSRYGEQLVISGEGSCGTDVNGLPSDHSISITFWAGKVPSA